MEGLMKRNKKAQSITEIATFGSLLILALSFLIRYGMTYNHQQEVQMEAFRRALKEAQTGNYGGLNAGPSMVLVKDVSLPDPSDRFGVGSRTALSSQANIILTNKLLDNITASDFSPGNPLAANKLPKISYVINPTPTAENTYTYTTAKVVPKNFKNDEFIAYILGEKYPIKPSSQTKIVEEEATQKKYIKALLASGNCNSVYCPTDLLTSADLDEDERDEVIIEPEGAVNGPATGAKAVDYQEGNIDAEKMVVDLSIRNEKERVTPENVQGLLPASTHIVRGDSLTLTEDSKKTTSISQLSDTETVTHTIRKNSGSEDLVSSFPRGDSQTWTTPK
jgi:hypothetical protein